MSEGTAAADKLGEGAGQMNTYPSVDAGTGVTFAFEIDNIYVSLASVARILTTVPGTTIAGQGTCR